MSRISNVLSGDTAIPVDGTGLWLITGGSASIVREGGPTNVETYLQIVPDDSISPVSIHLIEYEVPANLRGDTLDFGFYIKSDARIQVDVGGHNLSEFAVTSPPDSYASQTKSFVPAKGSWAFPRLNKISTGTPDTPQFISFEVDIYGHGGAPIYFARPVITPTFFHLDDTPTNVVQGYLPSDWLDAEIYADGVVSGLGKLTHVASYAYQDCYNIVADIENLNHVDSWNEDAQEFASSLVTPTEVSPTTARWLSQFVGAVLVDPSAGLTPWANLPKIWSQWAMIDSPDAGTDVDWSEVEGFNIELIGIEDYFQWQLQTQAYSSNAGTYAAMKAAAEHVLSGSKTVEIRHHPTSDWVIRVRTRESETSPLLLASAMYNSKPAGFGLVINDEYLPE